MGKDVRQNLRDTAQEVDLAGFLREAVEADKHVSCPKCRGKVLVPDWNGRTQAIKLLLEQGYGKPPAQNDTPTVDLAEDPARWTPTERAHAATHLAKLAELGDGAPPNLS